MLTNSKHVDNYHILCPNSTQNILLEPICFALNRHVIFKVDPHKQPRPWLYHNPQGFHVT